MEVEQPRQRQAGRPERSVRDPDSPAGRLAVRLRAFRERAGAPSYRAMAAGRGVSASALSEAARGDRFPSWEIVRVYLQACGIDPAAELPWYDELRAAHDRADQGPLARTRPEPEPSMSRSTMRPTRKATRIRLRTVLAAIGGVAAASAALVWWLTAQSSAPTAGRPPAWKASAPDRNGTPTAVTFPGATAAAAGRAWQGLSGPHCGDRYITIEAEPDGPDWHPVAAHAPVPGCQDIAYWTSQSGDTSWSATATWTFVSGDRHSCRFRIYVPDLHQAAGTAAYDVHGSDYNRPALYSFTVDQARYRGRWYTSVPYSLPDSPVHLVITNRGDGTPIAIGPAIANCD
jgi:hypothetical protein